MKYLNVKRKHKNPFSALFVFCLFNIKVMKSQFQFSKCQGQNKSGNVIHGMNLNLWFIKEYG